MAGALACDACALPRVEVGPRTARQGSKTRSADRAGTLGAFTSGEIACRATLTALPPVHRRPPGTVERRLPSNFHKRDRRSVALQHTPTCAPRVELLRSSHP